MVDSKGELSSAQNVCLFTLTLCTPLKGDSSILSRMEYYLPKYDE